MKRDTKKGSILALRQIEPQAPLLVVTLVGTILHQKMRFHIFSYHFDHCHLLDIICLCYHMQIQQNPMDQQIMEDPTLGPKFDRSSQNHNFYFMVEKFLSVEP